MNDTTKYHQVTNKKVSYQVPPLSADPLPWRSSYILFCGSVLNPIAFFLCFKQLILFTYMLDDYDVPFIPSSCIAMIKSLQPPCLPITGSAFSS